MIQPNELRIGNIVNPISRNSEIHLPIKNVFWKIQSISESSVGVYSIDLPNYEQVPLVEIVRNISPVELTPDILEAAGWYWNNEAGCYEHSDVRMSMNHNSISGWTMFNYVLKAKITNKIFYLHQLQNLYWCLCGEELQIDITKLNK